MKFLTFTIIILLNVFSAYVINAQTANPQRPSASDNGYLTEYGYSELEIGFTGNSDAQGIPALLKFTFLKELEAGLFVSEIIHFENGETNTGDPGIQLKYQFVNTGNLTSAIVGKALFVTSGSSVYTAYLVPTFQTYLTQIDLTFGTSFIKDAGNYDNTFFYALCFSPKIDLPFGFFLEAFGDIFSDKNSFNVDLGVSYSLQPDFVLDASYTLGLGNAADNRFIQIGLTKTLFKIF